MTTEEIHNWTRTGDNLECKHCNTKLTIGQEIDYTDRQWQRHFKYKCGKNRVDI